MKTSQLKLGNIVFHNGSVKKIDGIQPRWVWVDTMDSVPDEELEQIPLTEEWLLKFGAKELKPKRGVLKEFVLKTVRIEFSNSHNFYYKNSKVIISSVHQLQNLFYALTGQELILKP